MDRLYLESIGEFIALELPNIIQEKIGITLTHRYISGLSMGGWGALHLGAKYQSHYSGISAHSPITNLKDFKTFKKGGFPFPESSIHPIIDQWSELPTRFDCGSHDPLIHSNRELHRKLIEKNISHCFEEFEGQHDWDYWSTHLEKSFLFFHNLNNGSNHSKWFFK